MTLTLDSYIPKLIPAWRVYLQILATAHTPFIFILDHKYLPIYESSILDLLEQVDNLKFVPNLCDCDNFAFALKGFADTKGNGMGIVFGKYKGTAHCWNIALLGYNTIQIEPQDGIIVDRGLYSPWIVII